mgnify:CR=1 FL=1
MIAIVVTKLINGQPDLPPMDADSGVQLHYTVQELVDGVMTDVLYGGMSMLMEIPCTPPNCAVWVICSQATLDAMIANDTRFPLVEVCNA